MRAFTLLECMAAVALLALTAATVAVRVSPSVESARMDDARSTVLDADARARVLASRGAEVTLAVVDGRVLVWVGGGESPAVDRWLPDGVAVSLLNPDSREAIAKLRVDRLSQSPDYILSVESAGGRSGTLVAGLTGYAFAEEVSER
ncbi:MAG: prepilin-type N-terminal cleavage/methylation domain-containing protein [Planctomycetota bacterium]|nr:MAG: prepilin-type N-terminal cleavage/methylation domain-containing protein [Planctomycetota bacterium]